MEPKFNTSFIPKQSLQSSSKGPAVHEYVTRRTTHGPGFYISFLIFFVTCLTSVGLFAYTKYTEASIEDKIESLKRARDAFEPSLIKELGRLDLRMNEAKRLLDAHTAPTSVLRFFEQYTLRQVQYTTFTYAYMQGASTSVSVVLGGVAPDFPTVALQSDEFSKNDAVRDPVFSGLNVDKDDRVVFQASMSFDPRLVAFSRSINEAPAALPPIAAPSQPVAPKEAGTSTSATTTEESNAQL